MIEIIPAIDIIDGKCVRLSQGNYSEKKIYHENPLDVAKEFEAYGLKRLHLVDLEGAKAKHVVNLPVLEGIAKNTGLTIDFGGGIKTDQDIQAVFNAGAHQVTAGSIAITEPDTVMRWKETYGSEKIILGADSKDKKIAISGWQDVTELSLVEFIEKYIKSGFEYVICTDISKDGMLEGSSVGLYKEILSAIPGIKLIASGGVTSVDELAELNNIGVHGAIIGKAIYEGRISLQDLAKLVKLK